MAARIQVKQLALGICAAALLLAIASMLASVRSASGSGFLQRVALLPADGGLPAIATTGNHADPLVVIDPGHGGFDPGALSTSGVAEKDVVLALAKGLRDQLLRQGGARVALTRDDDRFLPLQERAEIARRLGADLFISLHADSGGAEERAAGASLYTLSQQASTLEAAWFAARENRADMVNGVRLGTSPAASGADVDTILFELAQRRAQDEAIGFTRLVVREAEGRLTFRDPARRSAALVVLMAPDVPSVLFEAGFMTNPQDAARLTSPEGQREFARVTAAAVRRFFAERRT